MVEGFGTCVACGRTVANGDVCDNCTAYYTPEAIDAARGERTPEAPAEFDPTAKHAFVTGDYSARAGRRVCAVCNETQGSKFHTATEYPVTASAEDESCSARGSTEGHGRYDCDDEAFDLHQAEAEGDAIKAEREALDTQGLPEWLDSIEARVQYPESDWKYEIANGDTRLGYAEWLAHKVEAFGLDSARVHRDISSQAGVQTLRNAVMSPLAESFGQDASRGILAVNPYAEGSFEWHAWGLGYDYSAQTGGVLKSWEVLMGEWADSPTPWGIEGHVCQLSGFDREDLDPEDTEDICTAFENGYDAYAKGWRV